MIVVNFAHPLTQPQVQTVEALTGQAVEQIIHLPAQFDDRLSFTEQATALVAAVGLSSELWQTAHLLVNLPAHSAIAGLVLAELHGRMGYFPAVVQLRRVAEITPPQFEVAAILDLQTVRDTARRQRRLESEG